MVVNRIFDGALIDKATKEFQYDFDPYSWAADAKNIALVNEVGDLNLLQYQSEGAYIGHFFYVSRGKQAVETARQMLAFLFNLDEVEVIIGLTPVEKVGAKWLTRKLGFKSYGEIETAPGPCELFILTRSDYEQSLTANAEKDKA